MSDDPRAPGTWLARALVWTAAFVVLVYVTLYCIVMARGFGNGAFEFFYVFVHPSRFPIHVQGNDLLVGPATILRLLVPIPTTIIAVSANLFGPGVGGMAIAAGTMAAVGLLGGAVLLELGLARGLRPGLAVLPALAFTLNVFLMDRYARDFIGSGIGYLLGAWALHGNRQLAWAWCLPLIAGAHPLAGVGALVWVGLWYRTRPQESRISAGLLLPIGLAAAMFATSVVTGLVLSRYAAAQFMRSAASGMQQPTVIALLEQALIHCLSALTKVLILFGTFGLLPFFSRSWLWLCAVDILYFVVRGGPDHGVLPCTVAVLALATLDAMTAVPSGPVLAPNVGPRSSAPSRRTRVIMLVVGAVVVSLFEASRNDSVQLAIPSGADGEVGAVTSMIDEIQPLPRRRCQANSQFAPVLDSRCDATTFAVRFPFDLMDGHFHESADTDLHDPDFYLVDLRGITEPEERECLVVQAIADQVVAGRYGLLRHEGSVVLLSRRPQPASPDPEAVRLFDDARCAAAPETRPWSRG